MLKNIQKYLLLNQPLLWNTRIVPMIIILTITNLIFFVIGFNNGKIDFTETNNNYTYNESEPILVFVGVLISLLLVIIWFVFYIKNNAFKSFYPKNNSSLFKEWLLIFSIIFMISMFSLSYFYAKEVRVRSYFSEKEAKRRCEILSLGSVFLEGSFGVKYYNEINQYGDTIQKPYNFSEFKNKRYATNSLINKNPEEFQLIDGLELRLIKEKTQNWLYNNDKVAVKSLMQNYLSIAREHRLNANINADKWFDLVYNEPDFKEINVIGKAKMVNDYNNNYSYASTEVADAAAAVGAVGTKYDDFDYVNKFKINKKGYVVEYYKHYVPAANLNYAYEKIADAWISPDITIDKLLFPLYFALGFSLLIFSFRISTVRNWIIAIITLGILNIFYGIISALIFGSEKVYLCLCLTTLISLFSYFLYVCSKKQDKGNSGIILNIILWTFGAFIPIIYYLSLEFLKWKYNYYTYYERGANIEIDKMNDFIDLLGQESTTVLMVVANFLFMFAFMFFMSIQIKKWKGIPEN